MFFGENTSVDEGIWGSAEYEFEFQGLGSIESKEEWGPDFMFLVLIPCIFFSLIGRQISLTSKMTWILMMKTHMNPTYQNHSTMSH